MIRTRDPVRILVFALIGLPFLAIETQAQDDIPKNVKQNRWIKVTVKAGNFDRAQTPIRFTLLEARLLPVVREALRKGPTGLYMRGPREQPSYGYVAQAEKIADTPFVMVTFIVPEPIRKGEEGRYWLEIEDFWDNVVHWKFEEKQPGVLDLKLLKTPVEGIPTYRPVFRYNAAPVSSPNYGPIQHRDAYIHPAYSPSGALITGDFSSSHPHHRGFFLAYEKTRTGELTPDFWNIHFGTGKIHSEGFDKPVVGVVSAKFSTKHRWDAKDKATGKNVTVLRERWDVEAYEIPKSPYWLFDITSTQQAVDRPLELLPYRYGGMAYRGPEPFVKGTLDVLTSENLNRKSGDQKPARWVDLTGPIAAGSDRYAGAMIVDHPSNPNYPNVARIHPTSLPFFCYVPAHDKPLTIAVDRPSVFRYRVLIHDGHPDKDLDERIARDFAEPPEVVVE